MNATLYSNDGSKTGTITLPESIFGIKWNPILVHEVVTLLQSSRRKSKAHAKGRKEVSGGGKKPWVQKGTGRARHGSTRSPIWIGGGVTHGPTREKEYSRKINKKARRKALRTVLSQKLRDGEIIFLEDIVLKESKTKVAVELFKKLKESGGFDKLGEKGGRTLVLIGGPDKNTVRSIRNMPYVNIDEARNINAEEALKQKYLVFTKEAVAGLKE